MTLTGPTGTWHNAEEGEGWACDVLPYRRGLIFPTTLYEFHLFYPNPLTWEDNDGYWRPDQHERETDLGSVPPPFSLVIPRDYAIKEFCTHDSAWRHMGLWWSRTMEGPYTFRPLSLAQSNDLLWRQLPVSGCDPVRRRVILAGVGLGRTWRRLRGKDI